MTTVRLRLGAQQASALQINLTDPAHDVDREPWWPVVERDALVFADTDRDRVASLLTDMANSEDAQHEATGCRYAAAARDALTRLVARCRA